MGMKSSRRSLVLRDAPHELHHEIGAARLRGSGVIDLGDMGMIHHRQGLALGLETGHDLLGVHAQFDDLESDAALDGFELLRQEHRPHAALAQLLDDLVPAG
jgi:hypothetical protein